MPAQVRRPNTSASAELMPSPMTAPMTSGSKYGIDQPPFVKPPSVSSSGPPGACITPSRLMNSLTMTFIARSFVRTTATLLGSPRAAPEAPSGLEHAERSGERQRADVPTCARDQRAGPVDAVVEHPAAVRPDDERADQDHRHDERQLRDDPRVPEHTPPRAETEDEAGEERA